MKETWDRRKLGEVCEFIDRRGVTPEKLGSRFLDSGYRVISARNIKSKQVDTEVGGQRFVDELTYHRWMQSPLLPDDVLLTSEAPLGEPAYIKESLEWCLGQRLFGIRTNKTNLSGRFLYLAFQSTVVREDLLSRATGATAQGIRQSELRNVEIPIPPLPEQQRIVALLDEALAGLATAKANAERSLRNARAVFESHLAVTFSRRGDGWAEMSLDEVVDPSCTLSYGIVQPGEDHLDGLPVVRPTDMAEKVICLEGLKRIDPRLAEGYRRTTLQGGELLLCVRGSTGVVSIAAPELRGANVTRGIVPVRFNSAYVLPELGYYLMKSEHVQSQIREKTYGAALMQINIRDLRAITLFAPSLKEQSVMALTLSELDTEVQRLTHIYERKLAALEELKKSLLQQAFNGEL